MKSKASIKGHPVHPILIAFPIAFFSGTFVLDLLFFFTRHQLYEQLAIYLEAAGIFSALLAAIPGIIDYIYTVPPKSSAKKRASKHALLNVSMLLIFTATLLLRINTGISLFFILILEGIAMILLTIAGWHGGTLVYRNQIGVDHRYAHAGKWKEERIDTTSRSVQLKGLEQLKTGQMKLIHVHGKRIVIALTESGYLAFDDHCTHRGASLAAGSIICGTVQCPWHGSQFDVKTGAVKAGPATENIKTYTLRQEQQNIFLEL